MTSISFGILKFLIVADMLLLTISLFLGTQSWVYSTQIGFISSTLVMIASIMSYRRMVNTRVEHGIITMDDSKDTIDKLEDPFDLYSEEDIVNQEEEDLLSVVKDERKKLKENRRSLAQTLKDTKAALSVYRLGAYVILILGFMYLNRHTLLHIPTYLLALSLPPVIIVLLLVTQKENHSQD